MGGLWVDDDVHGLRRSRLLDPRPLPGRWSIYVLDRWLSPPAGMAAVFVKWARGFFFMAGMIFLVRRWPGNQTDALG